MKKAFLIATPVLFCIALLCQFVFPVLGAANTAWNLFLLVSCGYMYYTGTFKRTIAGRLCYITLALLITGMLFKLQHWPGGSLFIFVSLCAIIVIYSIHFILKRQKKLLDWMKVFAVVIKAVAAMFWMLHWMHRTEISIASIAVLLLLIAVFYIRVFSGDEDVEKEEAIADSGNDIFVYKD